MFNDDGRYQRWVDKQYGPGFVRVSSVLQAVTWLRTSGNESDARTSAMSERADRQMSAFSDLDGQTAEVTVLEFWPDYGAGPVWTDDGKPVDLGHLGMDPDLVSEVAEWNGAYSEDKVPMDSPGDAEWLRKGRRLLREVRSALAAEYRILVTEPWWG